MTTPDPKPDNAPFEWRALTINKVERIQLERLRREQDRIERETREREAEARAAREHEAKEREHDAIEAAWFEAGEPAEQEPDGLNPPMDSSSAERRIKSIPPPKPRPSHPAPAPRRENSINVGLVLAACAFGASVYFSLRWVADVRQAHVARQLSSTVNATTPALQAPSAGSQQVNPAPPLPLRTNAVTPSPEGPAPTATRVVADARVLVPSTRTTSTAQDAIKPQPALSGAPPPLAPEVAKPTPAHSPGEQPPPLLSAPPSASTNGPAGRRLLVPSAGSPRANGPRVYRAGD